MKIENNIISIEMYRTYVSSGMNLEDIVEKIKGKRIESECEYETIDDCGVKFVSSLLERDWGRTIVYSYNKKELEFINSKYLSDYFKDNIRELLNDTMTKKIDEILNSEKDISQMSEEELKMIYYAIVEYYHINRKSPKSNLSSRFLKYLYKLDGNSISSFIKNNIDSLDISRQILLTSGLNDRASYYSGRGVNYGDLNEENLVSIFNKLLHIDKIFALNFVKMVLEMKTLGATEFINSFIRLGVNNFEYNSKNTEESNVSLDGYSKQERDMIALGTIFSAMNRGDNKYQVEASEVMKSCFLSKIKDVLLNMFGKEKYYDMIEEKYDDDWYSLKRYRYKRR